MRPKKQIYALLLCLLSFITVSAAVTFKAQKTGTIIEGERFQITFTLEGAKGENFIGPQLNNCELISDRNFSFTRINSIGSNFYRYDYICVYYAQKAGKVNVPSVSITVDGKHYKTKPFSFEIHKNTGALNQHISPNQQDIDEYDLAPKSISEAKSKTFLKIILSKNKVYEQEPVECKFKLYTQSNIKIDKKSGRLSLNDFLYDELQADSDKVNVEEYNGQEYSTLVLKHLILYPQKTGTLKINGEFIVTVLIPQVTNMLGMQYLQQQIVPIKLSDDISLEVIPLPSPRPSNFSGAVGDFSVNTKVSSSALRTNETATFTFTINGNGNIKYIKEPQFKFPSEFELYSPKINSDINWVDGRIEGMATYDYSFLPQSVGTYQIPAYEFVYFNPDKKEYITLKTSPINIVVNKGRSSGINVNEEKRTDIIDINLDTKNLSRKSTFIVATFWYWLIYIFIIGIFIFTIILIKKSSESDISSLKLAKANKVAMKRLKHAHEYMIANKDKQFYEEIINAIWGYLSDKLLIPTSQLIRDNVTLELSKYGADESLCADVIDVLNLCDMAIYAPQASSEQTKDIYNRTLDIINRIESIKRK